MTEADWLASDDPQAMLSTFRTPSTKPAHDGFISDRKLRLWVEACRTYGDPANDFFGNLDDDAGLRLAVQYWGSDDGKPLPLTTRAALLRDIVGNPFRPMVRYDWHGTISKPGTFNVRWITPQALSLAEVAYGGDWSALLGVADALEEAGCPAEEVCRECDGTGQIVPYSRCGFCKNTGRLPHPLLAHLRSHGSHVRGCWAADFVLGKE